MEITIDEKVCSKHHLTPEDVLVVLALRNVDSIDTALDNLVKRGVLLIKQGKYLIPQGWADKIDEALVDSTKEGMEEERLINLANKMRECYPAGKMPNTPYYYRCNTKEICLKLKKFFAQYGNYSDERILDATRRYVASYNGIYKYMPLLKYFISKNKIVSDEDGVNHVTEVSQLADYLENEKDTAPAVSADAWMMSARN